MLFLVFEPDIIKRGGVERTINGSGFYKCIDEDDTVWIWVISDIKALLMYKSEKSKIKAWPNLSPKKGLVD